MQNAVNIPKGFLELAPLHQGAGVQEDQAQVSSGVSSWLILWGLFTAPALKLYQHHTVARICSASTIQSSKKSTTIRDSTQTTSH